MRFIELDGHEVLANVLLGRLRRMVRFTFDSRPFRVTSEIGGSVNATEVPSKGAIGKRGFETPGIRVESIQPAGRLPWGLVVAP
jgi:hypothetical protein